jgi:hypothetical protein
LDKGPSTNIYPAAYRDGGEEGRTQKKEGRKIAKEGT